MLSVYSVAEHKGRRSCHIAVVIVSVHGIQADSHTLACRKRSHGTKIRSFTRTRTGHNTPGCAIPLKRQGAVLVIAGIGVAEVPYGPYFAAGNNRDSIQYIERSVGST